MTSDTAVDVSVRFAGKNDAAVILAMIRELAEYEKLQCEVIATVDALEQSLFGPKSYAEVLLADDDEGVCGFCLFFHNYSTFLAKLGIYIEDIYVREHARGKGVGKRLFSEIERLADERGCGRIEWWVLDWNKPAIEFYKHTGAKPLSEWTVYRLTEEQFKR